MHYKNMFDNWVGFVSGVFGGCMNYTMQIAWHEEWLKILLAGLTALVAGGMGIVGKYLAVWTWRKVKYFIFKKK
jgi:hypothetical protein